MRRLLNHARNNLIAYLALFVALGGTGYAAINLPNGSVTAASLNTHSIGGYVRAWAHVSSNGHVLSGSPGATVQFTGTSVSPPAYFVRWRGVKLAARCAPIATLGDVGSGQSGVNGVIASLQNFHGRAPNQVFVKTIDASGAPVPAEFDLGVVC
jgi:hypothetical protein